MLVRMRSGRRQVWGLRREKGRGEQQRALVIICLTLLHFLCMSFFRSRQLQPPRHQPNKSKGDKTLIKLIIYRPHPSEQLPNPRSSLTLSLSLGSRRATGFCGAHTSLFSRSLQYLAPHAFQLVHTSSQAQHSIAHSHNFCTAHTASSQSIINDGAAFQLARACPGQ